MGNTAQDLLAGGRDFSKAAIRDRSSRARAIPRYTVTVQDHPCGAQRLYCRNRVMGNVYLGT